jgi:AraC family cel operon transcriptional repressor
MSFDDISEVTVLHWRDVSPEGHAIFPCRTAGPQNRHWQVHRHDFYECFLVEKGSGRHVCGQVTTRLLVGELYFIRPEHAHGFRSSPGEALVITNVAMDARAFERSPVREFLPEGAWREAEAPWRARLDPEQVDTFLDTTAQVGAGARDTLDALYFLHALARLLRIPHRAIGSDLPDWLREALPMAADPAHLSEGLPGLMRICGRSPEHVARSFRRHLGMTPTEWLNAARIHQARRLLETTRMPVIEVAFEAGFDNLSYFHKLFKRQTGESPLRYRKRALRFHTGA